MGGVYVDKDGVHWDTSEPEMGDFFSKRSKYLGQLRRRFVFLKRGRMFFAKGENEIPHEHVNLAEMTDVRQLKEESDLGASRAEIAEDGLFIEISDRAGEQATVLLHAESIASARKWVAVIAQIIDDDG